MDNLPTTQTTSNSTNTIIDSEPPSNTQNIYETPLSPAQVCTISTSSDESNKKILCGQINVYESNLKCLDYASGKKSWLNDTVILAYLSTFNQFNKTYVMESFVAQDILFGTLKSDILKVFKIKYNFKYK